MVILVFPQDICECRYMQVQLAATSSPNLAGVIVFGGV